MTYKITIMTVLGDEYEFQHARYEKTNDLVRVTYQEGVAEFNWNNVVFIQKEEE